MTFKFQWSGRIKAAANDASREAAKETFTLLNSEFQRAITAKKWPWPNPPTTRDIVDTGSLRQSNTLAISGMTAVFRWTKDYATFVHEGAISGRRNYPARPWTDAILYGEYGFKAFDTAGTYKELWAKYFNKKSS